MREVAVDLEHELGALGKRAAEAGDVGRAETFLAIAVEHRDAGKPSGKLVGQLAGAVRGGVVDHEHAAVRRQHLAERLQHPLEVLALVVGRKADGDTLFG